MRCIQKLVKNGNATYVAIPRVVLTWLTPSQFREATPVPCSWWFGCDTTGGYRYVRFAGFELSVSA